MIDARGIGAVMLAVLVLLAGCGAGVGGPGSGTGDSPTAEPSSGADDGSSGQTGTLAFYVSDQPSAIGDFEGLRVTVTEIGIHRAGSGGSDEEAADENETGATSISNGTTAGATTTDSNETTTPGGTAGPSDGGSGAPADDGSAAGWITIAVDGATVDLTELQGANATRIANASLPAGEYNGVYIEVSNVTGTLTNGEAVRVELPSDRLRLNEGFALGANRSTSFVFDVAVHEAGGSGKYVLRPVIGESGADVPIRDVSTTRSGSAEQPEKAGDTGGGKPSSDDGQTRRADANATTSHGSG